MKIYRDNQIWTIESENEEEKNHINFIMSALKSNYDPVKVKMPDFQPDPSLNFPFGKNITCSGCLVQGKSDL
jgi:hypothetical protein